MNKPKILIVDDEKKCLDSTELLLKRDFNVLKAINGKDGLSLFETNPEISLILLDLSMPVMNGIEMLEKLRGMSSNVNVIIMTGESTHEWAIKCANLGVNGFITKPFGTEYLILKIKNMLGMVEFKVLNELWMEEYAAKLSALNPLVRTVLKFIENNYKKVFDRSALASSLKVTPEHLSYMFHKDTGISLNEYISLLRINKSKEYLKDADNMKIKEVAKLVGIQDSSYFCKIFKKHTGLSPSKFRQIIQPL